jgi:uncharacterized MAPEG superfamily protein
MTIINVVVAKVTLALKAKSEGKSFNRYESKGMQTADRLSGNFLEWYPIFMGPLWALALTDQLSDASIISAWAYVGLRGMYFALMLKHGVCSTGKNRSLWISTFPAYACLAFLHAQAMRLFF